MFAMHSERFHMVTVQAFQRISNKNSSMSDLKAAEYRANTGNLNKVF